MMRALIAYLLLPAIFLLIPANRLLAANDDLRIAMVLWRGETPAENGFKDKLKELGYSVQYTVMNAAQDKNELGRIARDDLKAHAKDFDYVYTFGTTASKIVKFMLKNEIPQVFNIVAAPVKAGLVETMESSGGNISGVSNAIALSLQLEAAAKVFQFKRLGLMFNPREKNSMVIRDNLYAVAQKSGFELVDIKSPPAEGILEGNLAKLKNGTIAVDAVYLPLDTFLVSHAELIGRELKNAKIKSIGSIKKYIDSGVLIGLVPDYHGLGMDAAVIVGRHRKGESLDAIPMQLPRAGTLVINRATSQALQVDIPGPLADKATFVD